MNRSVGRYNLFDGLGGNATGHAGIGIIACLVRVGSARFGPVHLLTTQASGPLAGLLASEPAIEPFRRK